MNLQFSPFGIIIYLVYALVIVMAVVLPLGLWVLKKKSWKWWVISVIAFPLLVAPIAEEIWIAHRFEKLCHDAGVHVYKKVEVDGYFDMTGSGISSPGPIKSKQARASFDKSGYKFHERLIGYDPNARPIRVSHVEKDLNGMWIATILDKPQARYHYKYTYHPRPNRYEEPVGWKLRKVESIVIDSKNNKTIAREVHFKRRPSLIEGLWIGLAGSGLTICNRPLDDYEKKTLTGLLPHHIFTPVSDKK